MVEVGHVRMQMHQLLVAVPMLMPHQLSIRMGVFMMTVVLDMLMVVLDRLVAMVVLMIAAQHEADTDRRNQQRHDLSCGAGVPCRSAVHISPPSRSSRAMQS